MLATGIVLTVGGPTWWHTNSVGHFVNSTHLWSVELFFAIMVIHLWGKFFMAAWRGKRGLTWLTGALAFFGSLGTAFTGYLSQTNFDSQWISTQAKDGLNAAGIGAYFNVLNTGQMLMWHITLLPLVVGLIVLLHVVLVRRHGVVPPIDGARLAAAPPSRPSAEQPAGDRPNRGSSSHRPVPMSGCRPSGASSDQPPQPAHRLARLPDPALRPGQGVRASRCWSMALLTVLLAAVFSSPDDKAITMQQWATAAPNDVVATATAEFAGTSTSATLRPAVQHARAPGSSSAAVAAALGRRPHPGRPGAATGDRPSATTSAANPPVTAALRPGRASAEQQQTWATNYATRWPTPRTATRPRSSRVTTAPSRSWPSRSCGSRAAGVAGGPADHAADVLRQQPHQAAAAARRRQPTWRTRPAPSTWAATSGE